MLGAMTLLWNHKYSFLSYLFANTIKNSLKSGIFGTQKMLCSGLLQHLFKCGWVILLFISGLNYSDLALSMAHKTSEHRIKETVIHQAT